MYASLGIKMKNFLERIKQLSAQVFHVPTADELALVELAEAQRQLLAMQTARDYSTRMVDYNKDRIRRLTAHIKKTDTEEQA